MKLSRRFYACKVAAYKNISAFYARKVALYEIILALLSLINPVNDFFAAPSIFYIRCNLRQYAVLSTNAKKLHKF